MALLYGRTGRLAALFGVFRRGQLVSEADAEVQFGALPYEAGADGLVWWGGNEAGHPADTAAFWAHTSAVVGPMVKALGAAAEACAAAHCGGRGRCASLEVPGAGCVCDAGHAQCEGAPRARPAALPGPAGGGNIAAAARAVPHGAKTDDAAMTDDPRPSKLAAPTEAHLAFHGKRDAAAAQVATAAAAGRANGRTRGAEDNLGAISHFGMQTFLPKAARKCSGGRFPIDAFAPERLDTDQWVQAAASFGAKYHVLVADHFSGFTLYDSKVTNYSVAYAKWRQGKGDVVADFVASVRACPGPFKRP
jgi:hypothetical protein